MKPKVNLAAAFVAFVFALIIVARWSSAVPAASGGGTATVHFRLVDASTGKATTAMVCLRNLDDGTVRLPPDGRPMKRVGLTKEFYDGVGYSGKDPSWIGPVRKTMGKGNNDDRSYVYQLRPSIPYWREPVMFQTEASFRVDLPPGRYRIAVSRGMEYVPVFDDFTVAAGKDQERTIPLRRWVHMAARGWYSGDVHVHHPTLKEVHKEFLLHYAEAEDLNVVNVLEMGHHKGTDFKQSEFGEASRVRRGNYCLVSGQEEPRSRFGHIIGLNLQALARDLPTYDYYDLAFKRLHAQEGALVGFAHFSWNGCALPRGFPWLVTTEELDFIELMQFNALNAEDYYDYLNLGFRLTAAAGSDTPWGSTIGEVRTYVFTGDELDLDTWFRNLGRGHTFVTNGPALEFTVNDELPGSEIKASSGDVLTIRARAWGHEKVGQPETLVLMSNQGALREVKPTLGGDGTTEAGGALELNVRVPVERSHWFAVSARCANGAMAHTTPVYVVIDDQPTWCPVNGPRIIERKLEEIAAIKEELASKSEEDLGITARIDAGKRYYHELRSRIAEGASR